MLAHLPTHNATRFVTLSINYRTPAEVMEVASRLLAVAAPTVEPSRSVRSTGEYPRFVADAAPTTSSTTTAEHARAALDRTGTRRGDRAAGAARGDRRRARRRRRVERRGRRARRADRGARPDRARRVSSSTTSSSSSRRELVTADRAGLRLLYVTITRTTKTLTIVHAEAAPRRPRAREATEVQLSGETMSTSLRPRRVPNFTTPFALANNVSSPPRPTL